MARRALRRTAAGGPAAPGLSPRLPGGRHGAETTHRPTLTPTASWPSGRPSRCAKTEEMQTHSGGIELTLDELRAVTGYAVACAEPALVIFRRACPDDPRPAAALQAARVFADGAPRSRLQRTAAADAHRAARRLGPRRWATLRMPLEMPPRRHICRLAKATQMRHILGPAAHAARAAELARGDDLVVAEYVISAAAQRVTPVVRDVLTRYPRAPKGRTRVAVLMHRLDGLLRDPPPTPRGRRRWAVLSRDQGRCASWWTCPHRAGARTTVQRQANHIYPTATRDGAPLVAELARRRGARTGLPSRATRNHRRRPERHRQALPWESDSVLLNDRALRVIEEIRGGAPPPEMIQHMRERMAELTELGIEAMDD